MKRTRNMRIFLYFSGNSSNDNMNSYRDYKDLERRIDRLEWKGIIVSILLVIVLILSFSLFKMRQELLLIQELLQ